jgi:hypothetical protein
VATNSGSIGLSFEKSGENSVFLRNGASKACSGIDQQLQDTEPIILGMFEFYRCISIEYLAWSRTVPDIWDLGRE